MNDKLPMYWEELERLLSLSHLDLDYSDLGTTFQNLTTLAAKIAGTEISLVNLVDAHTQWTISNHGFPLDQMPREDSVCQYTINSDEKLEVKDLSEDDRFKNKSYVAGDPRLKYYFGLPLNSNGENIGALCVLDSKARTIEPEKIELLKLVAREVVSRLKAVNFINSLKAEITRLRKMHNRTLENINSPLTGITGLAEVIIEQGQENEINQVLELVGMIKESGTVLLEELVDSAVPEMQETQDGELSSFSVSVLKDKLLGLYKAQAKNKNIHYNVEANPVTQDIPFSKDRVLNVSGGLIATSIAFAQPGDDVTVYLDFKIQTPENLLEITIKTNRTNISEKFIASLSATNPSTSAQTAHENGYEFGLTLANKFVKELGGEMRIVLKPEGESSIKLTLPRK